MKLTKTQKEKVIKLLGHFKNHTESYSIKENKIVMAPTLGKFIMEAIKPDNKIVTTTVKLDDVVYTLEVHDNTYVLTRILPEGSNKIVLTPEDIEFLNNAISSGNNFKQAVKKLAYELDSVEGRFGLWWNQLTHCY